jgi:hypothetical protein
MEKPKYKPEQMLSVAMRFTEEDLEANRRGLLSEAQLDRFRRNRTRLLALNGVAFVGLGLASLLCIAPLFGVDIGVLVAAGFVALFASIILAFSVKRANTWRSELYSGKAAALEGRVRLDVRPAGNNVATYIVAIDDQKFGVRKDVFLAFKNGDPYRLYYAPQSKTLLSAEWLRDESPQEMSDGEAEIQTRTRPDGGHRLQRR